MAGNTGSVSETPTMSVTDDDSTTTTLQGETPGVGETPAQETTEQPIQQTKPRQKAVAKKAAPAQTVESTETDADEAEPDVDELVYENWLSKQPGEIQELVTRQQRALRDALVDERSRRKQLSAAVKSLEAKTTGNQDVQAELAAMRGQLVDAQQRTQFYESAPSDVANPRLAFIAAREIGAISEKGERVDWDLIRREMPELFRKVSIPTANAGAGAKQDGAAGTSMNDFIRTALSRQRG